MPIKLDKRLIFLNTRITSKEALFKKFVSLALPLTKAKLRSEVLRELWHREELGNTYLGYNVALPHARCKGLRRYYLGLFTSQKGIPFEKNANAKIIFILIGPRNDPAGYIRYITTLSRLLRDDFFREKVLSARKPAELVDFIEKSSSE